MTKELLAKSIASEITLSEEPGKVMKKWREIFGLKQSELASLLEISASVVSDYESMRRKSPGVGFVRKFTQTLINHDVEQQGSEVITKLIFKKDDAIMDIREFLTPIKGEKLVKIVQGRVLSNNDELKKKIFGYTVIDSIKAILELTDDDLVSLYGLNHERALIFTKVKLGRSPMIAIKVTKPKPSMVVLHGLKPREVDLLAIKISKLEKIPLVVSLAKDEESLVENLKKIEN
jgi:putative transcriptional regulator